VDSGEFSEPRLSGKVVPNGGGDYSLFRRDGALAFDARYMLEEKERNLIRYYSLLWLDRTAGGVERSAARRLAANDGKGAADCGAQARLIRPAAYALARRFFDD
jgi:hypothetical protein